MDILTRFTARIGIGEDDGKFYFQISIGEIEGEDSEVFGPYETEREARKAMKQTMREYCEEYEMLAFGELSGRYVDLQTGDVRTWDEH